MDAVPPIVLPDVDTWALSGREPPLALAAGAHVVAEAVSPCLHFQNFINDLGSNLGDSPNFLIIIPN